MIMIRHHRNWIALLPTALIFSGCALSDTTLDELEDMETPQDVVPDRQARGETALDEPGDPLARPERGAWAEIAPGVWRSADDEGERWRVHGRAGHEWLRAELGQRLQGARDPVAHAFYGKALGHAATILDAQPDDDAQALADEPFALAQIEPIHAGLRAYATAALPLGKVASYAVVQINGVLGLDTDDAFCMSSCSVDAVTQLSSLSARTCQAFAYATAGTVTSLAQRFTCP
jgi:hypothetical protein